MKRGAHKGMVLCAGLGTRLLPITAKYPKPLVPVLNVPNLLHSFHLLEKAGIHEFVINVFHLPEAIEGFLKSDRYSHLSVAISRESTLLGTAGGLKRAQPLLAGGPFVLANCDFVTNLSLRPILSRNSDSNAIATMVLIEDEKRQPMYSKVGVDEAGRLCSLPKIQTAPPSRSGIFTGIHVLSSEVFDYLEEKPTGIVDVLYPALMAETPNRAFAEFAASDTYWYDTGDIAALWMASMRLLALLHDSDRFCREVLESSVVPCFRESSPGVWISEDADLPNCQIRPPVVIGSGCQIDRTAQVGPYAVIGDFSVVGPESRVIESVLLAQSQVNRATACSGKIVFEKACFPQSPLST